MLTLPARVGPFVVEALIARGGSAVVYRATQESPIRRTVAVKVMREGSESPQLRRRFVTEYRVLALMQHTNIETVLDAGVTAEGNVRVSSVTVANVRGALQKLGIKGRK